MNTNPMIVPNAESESFRVFISRYFADKKIVKISYRPKGKMTANDCYENVKKHIQQSGGHIAYGWSVWEWPGVMLDAFHHALWARPEDGRLIDITPDGMDVFPYRLFIPDQDAVFNDNMVRYENKRMPLSDDPAIEEFIAISIAINQAMEKIEPGKFGYIEPTPEINFLLDKKERLQLELAKKYR